MAGVIKIMPKPRKLLKLLYLLLKGRPWMTYSVIKMTLPCFI